MNGVALLPIFLVGLLGSVHCLGMCGGIIGALSMAQVPGRRVPVMVRAENASALPAMPFTALDTAARVVAYNAGRIGSYMVAGAIAGGVAGSARLLTGMAGVQSAAYWIANVMLVLLGLHLTELWRGLAHLESLGQQLWHRAQPLTRQLLPVDSPFKAFALGGLWGWLPCGMVYSVLLTALMSGSAISGAGVMLAFGLGTLPMLLAAGMFSASMHAFVRQRWVRLAGGGVVLGFGVLGLIRAAGGTIPGWLDVLCIGAGDVH